MLKYHGIEIGDISLKLCCQEWQRFVTVYYTWSETYSQWNFIKEKSYVFIPRFLKRFVGLFCLGPNSILRLPKIWNFRVHCVMVLSTSVIS